MASSAGPGRKVQRLTKDNVYEVLKRANPDWKWVAKSILEISVDKCEDIGRRYSGDECLKQAIDFWLNRCTFASWRTLLYQFYRFKLDALANEIQGYAEAILDESLTNHNINAALAEMSDEELGSFLVRHEGKRAELRRQSSTGEQYRIYLINHWLDTFHTPTWEYLAGRCFLSKKRDILQKIFKPFQKPESSLTLANLTEVQNKVKDWDIVGLPMQLGIQNELTKELEESYPDPTERTEAFINMFLEDYPAPSWELVCRALYIKEEYEVLEFVQNKYYQGTSETRRHMQAAMKKGKGKISITKVVLFGLPESGKTCTKHVILDETPPEDYITTPLALRPVTIYCFDITPYEWKQISRKDRDAIVARACRGFTAHRPAVRFTPEMTPSERMEEDSPTSKPDIAPARTQATMPEDRDSAVQQVAIVVDTGRATSFSDTPKPKKSAPPPLLDTYNDILATLDSVQMENMVFKIKRVQISDCGGQPQFHEILPIFIGGTTLYLYVLKLNEALRSRPMIRYSIEGQTSESYRSTETYEQILEHCLRVVRSQKAKGEKLPQIMIIGTHKDKEHECTSEDRAAKNKRLSQRILPEFKTEVKYYRHRPKEVIFPLNAKNPGEEEKEIAAQIRKLVEDECEADAVDIPLAWLALELMLEDLMTKYGRDVISKSELFDAAQSQNLQIDDDDALDAALRFLHQHNVVFYYPDILPDLVFANAQVLLNKVTELVRAAHKLRGGMPGMPLCTSLDELWQRFCDYALVSEVFLAQKEFQDHYVKDVFNHKHLMKLFDKLLIFAPFSSTEFFVPAILKKLTEEELVNYRSSPKNSSLVLTFPDHGGPLLGVFCATVGALLSEKNVQPCQWQLEMEEDQLTPSCLKRNCVQFSIVGQPGVVTIIDSFKHIEVHLSAENTDDLPSGCCSTIRRSFIQALRTATEALKYAYHEPCVGFSCRCENPAFHVACISTDKKLWICSKNTKKSGRLDETQLRWLEGHETGGANIRHGAVDRLPKLDELDLIRRGEMTMRVMGIVAPVWEKFALRLKFPQEIIGVIKKDHHQQASDACRSMFGMWLDGEGRKPISWKTVIAALFEAELAEHARILEKIIERY